jgi:uncharacterized protein
MITRQALTEKRGEILRLAEARGTYDIRVFGSVARQENTSSSDIDFLVKLRPGCSLFDLGGLVMDLQDLLGCEVDVVTDDALKPRIRSRVLAEARSI